MTEYEERVVALLERLLGLIAKLVDAVFQISK